MKRQGVNLKDNKPCQILLSPGRPQSSEEQKRVCELMSATDSLLTHWLKSKACAKGFAVNRDLENALLIAQGVIIYLMEANVSLTCTQIKCFACVTWLWWMTIASPVGCWWPLSHARCCQMLQRCCIIPAAPNKMRRKCIRAPVMSLSPWGLSPWHISGFIVIVI